MFDYAILQIVFAIYLMSIPLGFATAIGWCDPTEHRKRPVLFAVSSLFTAFGIFGIFSLVRICKQSLTPGQNLLDSATGLFNAIYERTVDSPTVRFAADQIHALVFSGVGIVFVATAFLLSIFFTYVLIFRIALYVDKSLKNSSRYGFLIACVVLCVLFGVITSQYAIMGVSIAYVIISAAFLLVGNLRLARSGGNNDDDFEIAESTRKAGKKAKNEAPTAADMEQEAKEFFGNTDTFRF